MSTAYAHSRTPKRSPHPTHVHPRYVNDGLRTLMVAQREVPEAEYTPWAARMHEAEIATVNREARRYAEVNSGLQTDTRPPAPDRIALPR